MAVGAWANSVNEGHVSNDTPSLAEVPWMAVGVRVGAWRLRSSKTCDLCEYVLALQ